MNAPSPYGPDYSLLHAVLPLSQGHRPQLAEMQAERSTQRAQGRASWRGDGRLSRAPVPVGGGVPAWAGSGDGAVPPMARAPQGSYEVDPDFGAADLGAPSAPSGGATGDGRAIADAGGPTGGTPQAGSAPLTPDLGDRSFDGSAPGGDALQWRSEAQALASRSRALSNTIGRLDRETSRSRSETAEGDPSGEATTALGTGSSSTSDPGTPENPNQVPLGGAEWLAAAGAAYALNRLRKRESTDDESGEGSSGTS